MVHFMKSKQEMKLKIGHELVRAFRITNIYFICLPYLCERIPGKIRNTENIEETCSTHSAMRKMQASTKKLRRELFNWLYGCLPNLGLLQTEREKEKAAEFFIIIIIVCF